MLSQPKSDWTFARLARESPVTPGMAFKVVDRLVAEGYASKERAAIRLVKPGELLDAWTSGYDFTSQKTTGYYCPMKEKERILSALKPLAKDAYALTMGAAASLLAPVVRSTDVYLYVPDTNRTILEALELKPVEFGGNVYLVEPSDARVFFDTQRKDGLTLVSALQLYLDLFNYPMRGREQAEAIREKVLEV
jgi:hypothetical protein